MEIICYIIYNLPMKIMMKMFACTKFIRNPIDNIKCSSSYQTPYIISFSESTTPFHAIHVRESLLTFVLIKLKPDRDLPDTIFNK